MKMKNFLQIKNAYVLSTSNESERKQNKTKANIVPVQSWEGPGIEAIKKQRFNAPMRFYIRNCARPYYTSLYLNGPRWRQQKLRTTASLIINSDSPGATDDTRTYLIPNQQVSGTIISIKIINQSVECEIHAQISVTGTQRTKFITCRTPGTETLPQQGYNSTAPPLTCPGKQATHTIETNVNLEWSAPIGSLKLTLRVEPLTRQLIAQDTQVTSNSPHISRFGR